MRYKSILVVVASLIASITSAQISNVPLYFPYVGHLTDADGNDLNITCGVDVRLYDSYISGINQDLTNSHVIYAERHNSVKIENGVFKLNVGSGTVLAGNMKPDVLVSKEKVYLELWIDGERMDPRQMVGTTSAVLKAQRAKYVDSVINPPKLNIATYDASKVTGIFNTDQIPALTTAYFTSGVLQAGAMPIIDTSKFDVSGSQKINNSLLPSALPANVITGGTPFGSEFFSDAYLKRDEIAYGMGSIGHLEMIPIPESFSGSNCRVEASVSNLPVSARAGLIKLNITINPDHTVSCLYDGGYEKGQGCAVNYMYICKK